MLWLNQESDYLKPPVQILQAKVRHLNRRLSYLFMYKDM